MNHYQIEAKKRVKTFIRKWAKEGYQYILGNGKTINEITDVTEKYIKVKSERGKCPFKITMEKVMQAVSYLLQKRTAIRKDLEPFSKFSSSMLGLLKIILWDIVKVQKLLFRQIRISLKDCRFYFSGACRPGDLEMIKSHGGKGILLSYYDLRNSKSCRWKYYLRQMDFHVGIDPGAYSQYNAIQAGKAVRPIDVYEYGSWVKEHLDVIDFYYTLDSIGEGGQEVANRNMKVLEEIVGIPPIPIWQCSANLEELGKLVALNSDHIGIGGTAFVSEAKRDRLFKQIFRLYPNIAFHWLSGSSSLLWKYPFCSRKLHGFTVHNVKKLSHSLIILLSFCIFKMHKLN